MTLAILSRVRLTDQARALQPDLANATGLSTTSALDGQRSHGHGFGRGTRSAILNSQHKQTSGVTDMWAQYLAAQRRVAELETARNDLVDRLANVQTHNAELGACIAHLRAEKAEMAAEIASLLALAHQSACEAFEVMWAGFNAAPAFTDPPPIRRSSAGDPPLRRADGTLAPQPKPWTPPKDSGDRRLIGR